MASNNIDEVEVESTSSNSPVEFIVEWEPTSAAAAATPVTVATPDSTTVQLPGVSSPTKGHEPAPGNSSARTKAYPQHPHSSSTFSQNKNEEYQFVTPPECPVFRPNDEEFKNPLTYISKIRPIAEQYGIAKILPPKTWTPPFTVDVDKLKFTPRVQRLNELEAKTRVKLNFLDQIAKFWELQGSSLKIPMVERKALDLYSLHQVVHEEGGLEQTTKERKWSKVAHRMQYPSGKSIGAILKGHYERILHPFDVYTSGKVIDIKLESESDDKDYKPHGIVSRQQITPPNETTARRSKRFANMNASKESACGLGTISASIIVDDDDDTNLIDNIGARPGRSRFLRPATPEPLIINDPLAKYICHICNRGDVEEAMLLCDGCDDSYHTFCLIPPLNDIPKGDWRCPRCVVEEVSKPTEAFGFEQAQREYTLQQFGEMADKFKADYFRRPVHLVPTDLVEREFWRIVSSIDEDVTVEYGADLHTMDHGSGFPTKSSLYLLPGDQEYAESSWNLNNLPLLEESILGHINADISGMKVPWMYVGMCFATFCWHNEDHWSYSINYLHWGEPKTWYGVPGSKAEIFEKTMKSAAPELFASQPDLLHQLVTIMNPNILMNNGVPVYRTDQRAGEFVITFPRAYHAGFNQGYNFAEAVNFAPADWLKMGRDCINHYSTLRRFCVFSHDELVCKMALEPEKLNFAIATACYIDMVKMVDSEKKLRKSLLEWGVTRAEREPFELIPDDERQCEVCKTTCFMSAVSCQCTKQIVCLRHYTELCECKPENHLLQYRYTLDEMPLMLKKLQTKAQSFEVWLKKCRDVIDPPNPGHKISLEELQEIVKESERKKYPSSMLIDRLSAAALEAEKCVTVIQQLDINKIRTRTRHSNDSTKYKLTMEELELFVEEIDNLCCIIKEGQSVRELLAFGRNFVSSAEAILSKKINKVDEKILEKLIDDGSLICIELHEMKNLRIRLGQVSWYNRSRRFRHSSTKLPLSDLNRYIKEGLNIIPDPLIEREIATLQGIVHSVEAWEKAAKNCFKTNSQHDLSEIELILEAAEKVQAEVPSKSALKDALKKAKEWLNTVDILQKHDHYPYYHTLESVVNRGNNIPLKLEELDRMKKHLESAREWKERTGKTFLRRHSRYSLLDVLSPRVSALIVTNTSTKRLPPEEQFTESLSPAQMVDAFKKAEDKEIRDMRELRRLNLNRNPFDEKFCVCKTKYSIEMHLCQLCLDWFHGECVPSMLPREPMIFQGPIPIKYLCPSCMRSRRPRLEAILSLLVSLQHLPIRLPEGEALQCLTERAMNWQDRARQVLATDDVAAVLDSLTTVSEKKEVPMDTKEDETSEPKVTIKIENEEITDGDLTESDFGNEDSCWEELTPSTPEVQPKEHDAQGSTEAESIEEKSQIKDDKAEQIHEDQENEVTESSKLQTTTQAKSEVEHAYSAPTVASNVVSTTTTEPICKPSPAKQSLPSPVVMEMKRATREALESLMMEGDLLEVSLDETVQLWNILSTSKIVNSELTPVQQMRKFFSKAYGTKDAVQAGTEATRVLKKRQTVDSTTKLPIKRLWRGTDGNRKGSTKRDKKGEPETENLNIKPTLSIGNIRKRKRATKSRRGLSLTTSDDDEECRAQNCHKPSGREVDWVQCDGGCNEWFHMFCVGLDRKQIKPDDDYICQLCMKANSEATSSTQISSSSPNTEVSSSSTLEQTEINVTSVSEVATTSTAPTTPSSVSPTVATTSTKPNKDSVS